MEDCTDPKCSSAGTRHGHIQLDADSVAQIKAMHEAAKLHAMGAEIERTRTVNTHDHNDLLHHMKTTHGIDYAEWRSGHEGYDDHIPGIRPKDPDGGDGDNDRMTHRELIAAHHHDHNKYAADYPHTTLNGEHFHH
jgi:hypothetical protein